MKLDGKNQEQDKLNVKVEVPVRSEQQHFATLDVQKGHKCFEMNLTTKEITLAEFENTDYELNDNRVRSKLVAKSNCIYATALNQKNAAKKFVKMLRIYYLKNIKN